jgi:hypothetical protein
MAPQPRSWDGLRILTGVGRLAGAAGLASAGASVAFVATSMSSINSPDDLDRWTVAWNILLLPVAIWLGVALAIRRPAADRLLAGIASGAGVLSCLLWATTYQRPATEPVWLGLSAVWWSIVGALLVQSGMRRLGAFSLVVGAFAALDSLLTAAGVNGEAYLLAAPKLPIAWAWALLVGARLVVDPMLRSGRRQETRTDLTSSRRT